MASPGGLTGALARRFFSVGPGRVTQVRGQSDFRFFLVGWFAFVGFGLPGFLFFLVKLADLQVPGACLQSLCPLTLRLHRGPIGFHVPKSW